MQLVLGRAHEELKERNQAPSVVREQLVSETFFHLLDILDTSNQPVILVQQHITLSIQLRHHLSHFAVLALPAVCISKLTVWAPTRGTRADRASPSAARIKNHFLNSWVCLCDLFVCSFLRIDFMSVVGREHVHAERQDVVRNSECSR